MSRNDAERELIEWVKEQPVSWAVFTLKSPRFRSRERWERLVLDAFNIMEHSYVKETEKRRRKESNKTILNRIVHLGGDSENGVAMHSQGLIETFDDDINRLESKLAKAWNRAVELNSRFLPITSRSELDTDSKIWVGKYDGDDDYLYYLNRKEGSNLGFGIEKIVWSATSLRPSAACNK